MFFFCPPILFRPRVKNFGSMLDTDNVMLALSEAFKHLSVDMKKVTISKHFLWEPTLLLQDFIAIICKEKSVAEGIVSLAKCNAWPLFQYPQYSDSENNVFEKEVVEKQEFDARMFLKEENKIWILLTDIQSFSGILFVVWIGSFWIIDLWHGNKRFNPNNWSWRGY